MNIKVIVVGELQANCYIVEKGNNCIIIDPGDEAEKIIKKVDPSKKVLGLFITHGHDDHIGAMNDLLEKYSCPVYNAHNLRESSNVFENIKFNAIMTPGHLDDCVCFYFPEEKIMFSGDFIFEGAIGRIDLPGGNDFDMKQSIKKILDYPDDIVLYPGHGNKTILGNEKINLNYFLTVL